ncbi:hypothetical protein O181_050391 [Austropuccinia psidii MF-1]|uniref:Uncharacterized protein n=1 Tax=Austropuccinia psidii MF-1 TaxID=1389203 RepID=A0A9Q3DU92_9BASI|nr:hypothetical protein [Austropuccinia psidii MF-1]
MLSILRRLHRPPDETPTLPPPSPSSPLLTLSHPRPYHPYACGVPSQHAPNTTYPYAHGVPSQNAPHTAYNPYACRVHSQHAPDTSYHPYTHRVPSQHAPDTTYPYAVGTPLVWDKMRQYLEGEITRKQF